jgi:GNAT superfamily N-acetyltransferase
MVVIRPGSAADAAQIADVQRDSWFAAYEGIIAREIIGRVMRPDDGARVRQTFLTRPWQQMIVAVAEPGVVGYASFGPEVDVLGTPWPHRMTTAGQAGAAAELYALYVHPAWWSTGAGRALMERAVSDISIAGYQEMLLWVLEDNIRARAFYERAGFSPDGVSGVLDTLGGVVEVRYRRTLAV